MTLPWFAGIAPVHQVRLMHEDPEHWGAWLSLTRVDAHKTLMLIEVEALRQGVTVQMFTTQVFIEGPGMATPAWSIAAKCVDGEWQTLDIMERVE